MRFRTSFAAIVRADEDALTGAIIVLASKYGRYGYRRITSLLRTSGWQVWCDRVQRIWRRDGLKAPRKHKPRGRLWLNDGSSIRLRPAGQLWRNSRPGPFGQRYPAIAQSWQRSWKHVVPFFAYPESVRRIIYTTNAIEAAPCIVLDTTKRVRHSPSAYLLAL